MGLNLQVAAGFDPLAAIGLGAHVGVESLMVLVFGVKDALLDQGFLSLAG